MNILQMIGFVVIGVIISFIVDKMKKNAVKKLKGLVTPRSADEPFSLSKMLNGMVNITSAKEWAKEIVWFFNLRKVIIALAVVGAVFAYGYWQGHVNQIPRLDLRGKEYNIALNEHYLHIKPDGSMEVVDKDKRVVKIIRAKDIPELSRQLRPVGFDLRPIVVAGVGSGASGFTQEIGAGVRIFKLWDWRVNAFVTQEGAYAGASYGLGKASKWFSNTSVGVATGKGWKGDSRFIIHADIPFGN
jgi:hypothetical protein